MGKKDEQQIVIDPVKICDDEIKSRKLVSAIQLFPIAPAESQFLIDADELLEQKLQENRSDPKLQNIIATLQQEQFEIIASDSADSFVVQGCAGSGKSQCLLHRLFYLRGELSDGGWEHVLLITPTKLFRLFSSDLMQRYQISNVANCSISELYQALLLRYDARFRNRQYHFELSEEYLPDEYLQKVYSEETIKTIEAKISQSIQGYIATACQTLDVPVPETVTAKTVQSLLEKLDEEISVANSKDTSLLQDPEYQKEAQELMQSINALSPVQKEDVAAFEEKTAGPAAFLKALACSDYDTDEGWELLDAVPAYYSRKVYTGLSRNQYFLPESTKAIPAPKDPAPVAVPVANAVETEESIKAAASDMSTPEAVAEAAAPKAEVISPEKDADDSEAERWHKLGIDNPAELLCAVDNSPLVPETSAKATSDFSTKKFENEITPNCNNKLSIMCVRRPSI